MTPEGDSDVMGWQVMQARKALESTPKE